MHIPSSLFHLKFKRGLAGSPIIQTAWLSDTTFKPLENARLIVKNEADINSQQRCAGKFNAL